MLGLIYRFVQNSRLARLIGTVLAALAAVLTFGAIRKREGVAEERAREAQRDAQANEEAHDRINQAETGDDFTDDERREWLRDFNARHKRDGSPKAGGR